MGYADKPDDGDGRLRIVAIGHRNGVPSVRFAGPDLAEKLHLVCPYSSGLVGYNR
jgi:hypothetical protein